MSGAEAGTVWFVGLDVHTQTIAICVVDATGKIVLRETVKSRRHAWREWMDSRVPEGVTARFALEALAPSRWVLLDILERDLEATLVHPYGVKLIVQSKKKSDRVDAYQLADLLRLGRLPEAYVATVEERELRVLVRHRSDLRASMTRSKNRVHAILHEHDEHCALTDVFGKGGRRWLASLRFEGGTKLRVDHLLAQIDQLATQVSAVDAAISARVKDEPLFELVSTIPGVGVTLGAIIRAEAGDIRRFKTADQFAAYTGLTPATWESGGSRTSGGITKQGNRLLRFALVEAALHVCRWSGEMKQRYTKLRRRIKKHKARVAIARRLAVAIWHMARTGEAFRFQERPAKADKAATRAEKAAAKAEKVPA